MALLEIKRLGCPTLRRKGVEVETFDDELRRLVDDMFDTMAVAEGFGLAAPQVGVSLQVAVLDVRPYSGTGERRVLVNPRIVTQEVVLNWQTPQGPVRWTVDLRTGDPAQSDLWYPHAICISRPEGPGRLVRLDQLEPGETIRLRPSTFDLMTLDGTARRYDLRYDAAGRRPHFILGEPGRRPHLLEQVPELLALAGQTGWNPSQVKGILGQVVECYEKWVRDAPAELRASGRDAWRTHCAAIFRRYLKNQPEDREQLTALLQDEERPGLLFDAFEWSGFIEKDAHSPVVETEQA